MATVLNGSVQSVSLPENETAIARQSSDAITHFVNQNMEPLTLRLEDPQTGQQMEATVPALAVRVLAEVLAKMAEGNPVTLVPLRAELSTQQAADLLGVSRPYFIKLLEQDEMPFRKVGEQRRVRYTDLMAYIQRYQQEATEALNEMTAEAQCLGLYE